jgi:short-subunit dehydrogenase
MALKEIANKTILLTGASGGIGCAIAKALSERGARLILVGRNDKTLSQLNQSLGGQHLDCLADMSTQGGRDAIMAFCENEVSQIDVVINNAGVSHFGSFEHMDPLLLEQLMHTNLISQMLLCQAFIPLLSTFKKSEIINMGSTFGSIGYPGFTAYCASKFGLRGFSEALSRELSDRPISIRYFAPRATQTAFNTEQVVDMNKALGNGVDSAEQVAEAFIGFLGHSRHRTFLGWPEKLFVRLNGILPTVVDQAIAKKLSIIKRYL